jgi:hypothetical protein
MVPQIDYFTDLDRYILYNAMLCAIVTGWAGILTLIKEEDTRLFVDRVGFGVLVVLFAMVQGCFIGWATHLLPCSNAVDRRNSVLFSRWVGLSSAGDHGQGTSGPAAAEQRTPAAAEQRTPAAAEQRTPAAAKQQAGSSASVPAITAN